MAEEVRVQPRLEFGMRNALLIAAAFLLLSGCQPIFGPTACTLIGCESGLAIEFATVPTEAVRVEAFVREGGPRYVFDCPDANRCGPGVFFPGFTPEVVTIRVTTASGSTTQTVRPKYTKSRPNGPDCPPECIQARVQVTIPGA
jgi:hypothetical protein